MVADILRCYGVDSGALLGVGMEAQVYARDDHAVVKLYHHTVTFHDLRVLRDWYDALDASRLSYALPRIFTVDEHDGVFVTVERRLAGVPMARVLPDIKPVHLDLLMHRYVDAILELRLARVLRNFRRYKLFDPLGVSAMADGDWHDFLGRYLDHQSARLAPVLRRDVAEWDAKLARLRAHFQTPYTGPYKVIHGDVYPGNLLLDHDYRITGLLDFGLMTMLGDPLWDVALGGVFFDMYDELGVGAREQCLSVVLGRLGEGVRATLYSYVLAYCVIGADAYDPSCADGHYRWCVENLNDAELWRFVFPPGVCYCISEGT